MIRADVVMELVKEDTYVPIESTWYWNENDPFAVRLDVGVASTIITWVFAFELFQQAVNHSVVIGQGDVKVWTDTDYGWINLSSPEGSATFRFPIFKLKKFVYSVPKVVEFEITDEDIENFLDSGK